MESALLKRNPVLADDFDIQLEQAKAKARHTEEVVAAEAASIAEVIARYRAQAVDEPIQISAVEMEAYLTKYQADGVG